MRMAVPSIMMLVSLSNFFANPVGLTHCNGTSFDGITKMVMILANRTLRSSFIESLATFTLKSSMPRGVLLVVWTYGKSFEARC